MMKKLAAVAALVASMSGCCTAIGAGVGTALKTPQDDSPQIAGVVLGIAADVALAALVLSAASNHDSQFTYGPGEGDYPRY